MRPARCRRPTWARSTSDFFTFTTSILVLIMVILGGIGNIWGVLCRAIALTYIDKSLLPWIGTRVQAVAPDFPNPTQFNFLIFGILLVAMMRFRPEGFLPSRQRAAELERPRPPAGRGGDGRRGRDRERRDRAAWPVRDRAGRPGGRGAVRGPDE